MDAKKFREIEELYKNVKERQAAGEISADDMKSELKKMMLRDEDNRYWMLGGKTGGWYVHDGSAWTPADPYENEEAPPTRPQESAAQQKTQPIISIDIPKRAVEAPEVQCRYCQSRLGEHDTYCKFCGGSQKAPAQQPARRPTDDEIQVRAVRLLSCAVFFGGLGLIAGVVFGASFGIFNILGDAIYQFPLMLQEMRGKFLGGLFFGAIGGIAGFFALALFGTLLAMLYNAIAFIFFGGLRFKIKS